MLNMRLPMGLVIKGWVTNWTDGRLVTSCLEEQINSILEKIRTSCVRRTGRSVNMACHICNSCTEYWSCGQIQRTSYIQVLLNKYFKDHLKQLYYKWLLAGDNVPTPNGTKRWPVKICCATDSNHGYVSLWKQQSKDFLSVVYMLKWMREI
jgi:hypothetical protein